MANETARLRSHKLLPAINLHYSIYEMLFQQEHQLKTDENAFSIGYNMTKAVMRVDEKEFALRLSKLRHLCGVSARDMSLSMGQNHGYINNIETGKVMPSLIGFFYICEYLKITPSEFFDTDSENPQQIREIVKDLKQLSPIQLASVAEIVHGLTAR